jgi:hypothetical protein
MKFSVIDNLPKLGVIVFAGLAISALTLRFFAISEPVPAPIKQPPHLVSPPPRVTEARETFAPRMPSGKGVAVIAGNGDYNTNHILVAVPDQFHKIHYLPGSDPRAVKYLSEMQAAHEQTAFDNGPGGADLSSVPLMRDALSSQQKHLGVDVGEK